MSRSAFEVVIKCCVMSSLCEVEWHGKCQRAEPQASQEEGRKEGVSYNSRSECVTSGIGDTGKRSRVRRKLSAFDEMIEYRMLWPSCSRPFSNHRMRSGSGDWMSAGSKPQRQ